VKLKKWSIYLSLSFSIYYECDYLSKFQFTTHLSHFCWKNSFFDMKIFKLITWYPNMAQTMWNDMVKYTFNFHKNQTSFKFFKCICVFKYIDTLHLFPQIYSNLTYMLKNIVKCFQKFEVEYIQTWTPLESTTMWHPKGRHYNVFSP